MRVTNLFSLRFVLAVPFAVIIVVMVGLTGYLEFRNSQDAAHSLVGRLQRETVSRINERLNAFLQIPVLVNNLNLDAIRLGQLDVEEPDAVLDHFLEQMQHFDTVAALTYASVHQESIMAWRDAEGANLGVTTQPEETGNSLEKYETLLSGDSGRLVLSISDDNTRTHSWYQAAVETGEPVWTSIFMGMSGKAGIDAIAPVYAQDGTLLGVLDTSLNLDQIKELLQGLSISENGEAFIIDESGFVVATSRGTHPLDNAEAETISLPALESDNPLV